MLPSSITPDFLRRIEALSLRARRAFLGTRQGGHVSLKRGHGIEFSDYRKYELGDDPRHIDWGVFARSERLYVKQFREEQDLSASIFIDSSASMRYPEDEGKWELASAVALSLSYLLSLQQDRVMLSVPGVRTTPYLYGAKTIHRFAALLDEISFPSDIDFLRAGEREVSRIGFPGIAVVLSDLLMPFNEVERFFNVLRAKNLDITVIQVLGKNDENPFAERGAFRARDSETGQEIELALTPEQRKAYREAFASHMKLLGSYFEGARIPLTVARPSEGLEEFVFSKLTETGLLR